MVIADISKSVGGGGGEGGSDVKKLNKKVEHTNQRNNTIIVIGDLPSPSASLALLPGGPKRQLHH